MNKERLESERLFQSAARGLKDEKLIAHYLYGIRLAIIEHSENTGKWLAAVALAASTPQDNSAEVQKQIDQHTSQFRSSTDALDAAVQSNKGK